AIFIAPPEPNNYGGVSLSYPIQVTQGRAGVQPNLSISYSSTGGDGWVGMGWNIGLGAITRTPEYGALYYDSRDSFTWNGKRLIKVSGSTSSENGTYRPEITDQSAPILVLSNVESGGIWEVRDSSGTKTTYGDNSSGRIYNPDKINQTYSWYLTKTEDLNGNYMQVTYDTSFYSSNRSLYLKEIRYTGNSRSGTTARQYVKFITK
ncbi:SpvB/TcaC N-terminal domain-containing protein, partial [Leptospira wolffii]